MLAVFGRVSSPYWHHNPGSEERLPRMGGMIPTLTPEQTANFIVRGIENDARVIVRPVIFRAQFLLNSLFPRTTAMLLRLGWKRPQEIVRRHEV